MSTLASPERIWWKPLGKEEKIWLGIAIFWAVVMFFMMIVWGAAARQDTPTETYRISTTQYTQLTNAFVQKYQVRTEGGLPVVSPPGGSDVYLMGRTFQWYPILELKKGQTYRVHLSSVDVQHGFSLQSAKAPLNMNFQALPEYDYVITLTPAESGDFYIVCNEFCGLGHHTMTGKIIVKE
ncbi:MAG: cytochrome C oxidase subunit II [Chloroflexi bacterium]|nr:cytochrome C oxidase subunit II [Chloroflexota bacterium]